MRSSEEILSENLKLKEELESMKTELADLKELVKHYQNMLFKPKKETVNKDQLSLFEIETLKKSTDDVNQESNTDDYIEVPTHKRKKRQGKKQATLDQYPQETVICGLEDCTCPDCQHQLSCIGKELVRRELVVIPTQFKVINYYQSAFKCQHCSENELTDKILKAPVPKAPIPNSLGSASLLAETMYQKYAQKVPAYRQEDHWKRYGLDLSRATICNWHINVCEQYLSFIYLALQEHILSEDLIHIDETTFKVLASDKVKSYFWVLCSGRDSQYPIAFYSLKDGRGKDKLNEIIKDYSGTIQVDMYSVYLSVANDRNREIQLAACWAHLRRKFYEVIQVLTDHDTPSHRILEMIDKIFALERKWDEEKLSTKERYKKRQHKLKPKIDELFQYIERIQANHLLQGKFKNAVQYALEHKPHFYTLLSDGRIVLSNNKAERAVKCVVMCRKNQLFAASFEGAASGGIILTLIETAKANGLDPWLYLNFLLTHLPNEYCLSDMDVSKYLPWSPTVQRYCGKQEAAKETMIS